MTPLPLAADEPQRSGADRAARMSPGEGDAYRAVCVPAVAALALGVASLAAWAHFLLWIVPVAAVALGIVALAQIRRYAPNLTGRGLALLGIGLAIINGVGAATQTLAHRYVVDTEARRLCDMWIGDVRGGNLRRAHQMTLIPIARLELDEGLESDYAELPKLQEQFAEFAGGAIVQRLKELSPDARIEFGEVSDVKRSSKFERLEVLYDVIDPRAKEEKQRFRIKFIMHRISEPGTEIAWRLIPANVVENEPN
ncbi:MAG: DUF4190 domain-containing protein [Pirellulales bacterium]|nr:DUF4190 domain-containing protein [Pirellulales bacterium]